MHSPTADSSTASSSPLRVLLVEDDDFDAELITRMLKVGDGSSSFVAERAADVKQALQRLQATEIDALLLDLGLPDSTRFTGLQRLLAERPGLPIVVITGNGEGQMGIEAVRAGAQDFLVKDQITSAVLDKTLHYAIERVRALKTEKQLLEETLHGTIEALTTVLSLVNPTAFGRAQRLKEYVSLPAQLLGMASRWTVEVAAMVSQIGWVQHSPEECDRQYATPASLPERRSLVQDMPAIAAELLANIPHLGSVRSILALQVRRSDKSVRAEALRLGPEVFLGMELLYIAIQFDILETQLKSKESALESLRQRKDEFEEPVFRAFVEAQLRAIASSAVRVIRAKELLEGMILADDVLTPEGRIVVARGHEVTPSMLARLRFFGERARIAEPIRVHTPRAGGAITNSTAA